MVHPADMPWMLPEDMPWDIAPMAEPLTIAIHGIHRGGLKKGEHVAIIGAGPIGLLAAMSALAYGAEPIVIDVVAERLSFAKELGVKYTIHSTEENLNIQMDVWQSLLWNVPVQTRQSVLPWTLLRTQGGLRLPAGRKKTLRSLPI